jgi:L-rhamnose mutarotase
VYVILPVLLNGFRPATNFNEVPPMYKLTATMLFLSIVALAERPASSDLQPVYGPTNPTPPEAAAAKVKCYGSVVELRPEKEQYYRQLHAHVWPEVVAAIRRANIRNYNIFVAEIGGKKYLFSFMEHTGDDPKKDFAGIALDPMTRNKWWPETDDCQKRLPGTPADEQWLPLERIMHID